MNHDRSSDMNKHLLIMLACCLVPLALILAVSVFGISLGALTPLIPYALALMCPLMMIVMMRGMMHEHNATDAHAHHTNAPRSTDAPQGALPAPEAPKATASSAQKHYH